MLRHQKVNQKLFSWRNCNDVIVCPVKLIVPQQKGKNSYSIFCSHQNKFIFHFFIIWSEQFSYEVILLLRYVEWICRAEDLVLAEDRTTEDDKKLIMEARQKAAEKMKKFGNNNKNDSVETNSLDETDTKHENNQQFWRSEKRFRFFVRRLCKTAAWFWFVIVLVIRLT